MTRKKRAGCLAGLAVLGSVLTGCTKDPIKYEWNDYDVTLDQKSNVMWMIMRNDDRTIRAFNYDGDDVNGLDSIQDYPRYEKDFSKKGPNCFYEKNVNDWKQTFGENDCSVKESLKEIKGAFAYAKDEGLI